MTSPVAHLFVMTTAPSRVSNTFEDCVKRQYRVVAVRYAIGERIRFSIW